MIFGKQLCQSYQKLAQLSRTHFVFFWNHSTAEKLNFQWHASFGFIEFFFGNLNFFMSCLTPLPKWSCRTFFFRFGKNSNFLSFFYVLGRQEPVWLFSWSKTNSNWAPLEKWWRTKIFILSTPLFFCLRINFTKSVITQSINIRDLLTFEPFDRF